METLIGVFGAAFALLAVVVLYFGGAAVVLRLIEQLRSAKDAHEQDPSAPSSAT